MARLRNFGGRKVSKQTRKAARKLMRGKSTEGGDYSRNTKGMSRRDRKREAVASVYASKRQAKFGDKHNATLGSDVLAGLGVKRNSFKKGGFIQHD